MKEGGRSSIDIFKINRVGHSIQKPVISLLFLIYSSNTYRAFHGFGQAKFADGGSILGSSQFTQLPQLPLKIKKGQID